MHLLWDLKYVGAALLHQLASGKLTDVARRVEAYAHLSKFRKALLAVIADFVACISVLLGALCDATPAPVEPHFAAIEAPNIAAGAHRAPLHLPAGPHAVHLHSRRHRGRRRPLGARRRRVAPRPTSAPKRSEIDANVADKFTDVGRLGSFMG